MFGQTPVVLENTANQATLQTPSSQYYAGLRGRLRFGAHELGLTAADGGHRFYESSLTLGSQTGALVPNVDYSFVRFAFDARLRFDELSLGASLGARLVQNTGPLEANWFPSLHAQAIQGRVFIGYRLGRLSDVLVGADYLRYAFDFNPVPAAAQSSRAARSTNTSPVRSRSSFTRRVEPPGLYTQMGGATLC